MKATKADGNFKEIRVGDALIGWHFTKIEITHSDIEQAGGIDKLLQYMGLNCLQRLVPVKRQPHPNSPKQRIKDFKQGIW